MGSPIKGAAGNIGGPTQTIRDNVSIDSRNKKIYRFWTHSCKNQTYDDYRKLCNNVCRKICNKHPYSRVTLIAHSTGCAVIVDPKFKLKQMKNIDRIVFLSPAIFTKLTTTKLVMGDFPFNETMFRFMHVFAKRLQFVMIPKILIVNQFLLPQSVSTFDSFFHPQWIKMNISLPNLLSFMIRMCTARNEINRNVFDCSKYKFSAIVCDNDRVIDVPRFKKWLPKKLQGCIHSINGDHETPLSFYINDLPRSV